MKRNKSFLFVIFYVTEIFRKKKKSFFIKFYMKAYFKAKKKQFFRVSKVIPVFELNVRISV